MRTTHDGRDTREPYPLEEPELSIGDVVGRLTSELGALINAHVRLAKIEVVEDAKKAGRGAGMMGGGAVAGWIALLILSMAAGFGLAEALEPWLAFLIVGAVWALIAAVLLTRGKKEFDEVEPAPEATMEEIEKDKEWMKRQP